jgi:hypothetical protein
MLTEMPKGVYTRSLPWRRFSAYFLALSLASVLLGVLGGLMNWGEGTTFVVTVLVGTPISFAVVHDTLDWLRRADGA